MCDNADIMPALDRNVGIVFALLVFGTLWFTKQSLVLAVVLGLVAFFIAAIAMAHLPHKRS